MKIGYKQLIEEAERHIETISVDQARVLLDNDETIFVDLRDIRELEREGKIPGAVHAPRGMLEFWVDPDCAYHRKVFAENKKFVFYCAAAWRSALATQTVQQMGMENVCHMAGGFMAWKEAEMPIDEVVPKS